MPKGDAHNTTSEGLKPRADEKDWTNALKAVHLNTDPTVNGVNGVTLYSFHHQAIKQRNAKSREQAALEQARPSV